MGENNLECFANAGVKAPLDRRLRILKSNPTKKPHSSPRTREMGAQVKWTENRKQSECNPVLLESCHSLQASIFGEPAGIAQAGKNSVLIDSKNADAAGT
jgi:hypothetical protein